MQANRHFSKILETKNFNSNINNNNKFINKHNLLKEKQDFAKIL